MIREIRKASKEDVNELAYVHYNSWIETYTNLISKEFLETRTIEKSINMFSKMSVDNVIVLEINKKVVGFINYGKSRDSDLLSSGEVYAIYILKQYHKLGCGTLLMNEAIHKLKELKLCKVAVWVLKDNDNSINFYEKLGFVRDNEKEVIFHNPVLLIRLVKDI